MPGTVTKLCQYLLTTLERDLTLDDGTTLPAGTEVLLLPQTTAHSVRVPGNQSLAEAWDTLSKAGHAHPEDQRNLADYEAQLLRYAERLTALEAWAARNGYTPPTA